MSKEILDPGFAVFNGHIKKADKKATKYVQFLFKDDDPEVIAFLKMREDGIMDIFNRAPNKVEAAYIALVTYIVNGGKSK